ncbi:hypothetical protein [Spongiibacter sp.]|uniref:hypothetical protein n=1 Tax=Spongiibacter sp. TaxID=2024860 RepID=UPI0035648AF9
MNDYFPLVLLALLSLVAAVASVSRLRRARIIEDTPTSKIRSAPQGYVELVGYGELADGQQPLLSKLGQHACLWYRYRIERYERSGKNSHWRNIEGHSSDRPLLLNDGSGHCYIYPDRADISSHRKRSWYGNSRYPIPGQGSSLLGRRYRYTEELLCEGDLIYTLGLFETHHPVRDSERNNTRMMEILSDWKQDYDRLVTRFDRNGDGDIDLEEWQLVRSEALRQAERENRSAKQLMPVNTLSYSPSRQQPFIIATSEPESLSRRYRWQSLAWLLVSLGCAAGLAWLLVQQSASTISAA